MSETQDIAKLDRVAALVRRIAAGQVTLTPIELSWKDTFAGNCSFLLSTGDTLTVFNDCDDYDYIDSVRFVDGTVATYTDIYGNIGVYPSGEPDNIDLRFSHGEFAKFIAAIIAAPSVACYPEHGKEKAE